MRLVPDPFTQAIDTLQFFVKETSDFRGNHFDLTVLSPGHKLISFCHNKKSISMNFAGHPAARTRAQYSLSSGPSSGVVQYSLWLKMYQVRIRNCFDLQSYTIKTEQQAESITFRDLFLFRYPIYIHKAPSFISIILPVSRMLRKRPFEGFVYFFGDQPGTFCIRVYAIRKQALVIAKGLV